MAQPLKCQSGARFTSNCCIFEFFLSLSLCKYWVFHCWLVSGCRKNKLFWPRSGGYHCISPIPKYTWLLTLRGCEGLWSDGQHMQMICTSAKFRHTTAMHDTMITRSLLWVGDSQTCSIYSRCATAVHADDYPASPPDARFGTPLVKTLQPRKGVPASNADTWFVDGATLPEVNGR